MDGKVPFLATMLACLMVSKAQEVNLANLDSRLKTIENIVANCKCADDVVAFSATMGGLPTVPAVAHQIIPFPGVITNAGGGYSKITNVFTAPVSGVYAFFAHLDVTPDYAAVQIVRNGEQVKAVGNSDGDSRFLSTYVILNLHAGDIVDVRHANNAGTIDGGGESTFAGFRLGDIPRN